MPRVFRPPTRVNPPVHPPPDLPLNPAAFDFDEPEQPAVQQVAVLPRHRRYSIEGISKAAIRKLARRGGCRRTGPVYVETRGVLRVFLERVLADAALLCEHGRRRTISTTDVVRALRRNGHVLYGFPEGDPPTGRRLKKKKVTPTSVRRATTSMPYDGHSIRVVPAQSLFDYRSTASGYELVAKDALARSILAGHGALCNSASSGVGVARSLKANRDGDGLLYQDGCALVIAERDDAVGEVKGVAIVCEYTPGEGLIEPVRFGRAVDDHLASVGARRVLMLELICAVGARTADGKNSSYVAKRGLVEMIKTYADTSRYEQVVLKAENGLSKAYFLKRGFTLLLEATNRAAMAAAPSAISI